MSESADKPAGITELVGEICKKHGEGTALVLGADAFAIKVRGICPTGIATIDAATGRWGIPYGRLTVLSGSEGSGKTTLALHLAAECQKSGGIVLYQDMEYKLDPDLAKAVGVNLADLIISQPPHLEDCLAVIETVIASVAKTRESGSLTPVMVILDSINAALAKCELEGEYTDQHYAPQARVMSLGLKKLVSRVHLPIKGEGWGDIRQEGGHRVWEGAQILFIIDGRGEAYW
jgi:recombination protein RecA